MTLGASNHSDNEREVNDYYATDPNTLRLFLDKFQLHKNVWECACGEGYLSEVLKKYGYVVYSTDLVDRGYGEGQVDFLKCEHTHLDCDILTNPPYKYAKEFVEKALKVVSEGKYVVMLLKIQFLEGQKRLELFKLYPPKMIYVNSKRQTCYINGEMTKKMSSATCYCWFVWEKGFKGKPTVDWISGEDNE